jgi:glycerophosphoryl diester phosphodiesterase
MKVICYGCGKGEYPENTLEAISHCQKINSDWRIEMDLQMTKDGKVVLFHDDNLLRITNIEKRISEVNYSEIKNFDAAYNFREDLEFPLRGKALRIPLLENVFKEFPKAKYLLDIHSKNIEIIEKVIDLVEQNYVDKQIVVVSKHHSIIELFRVRRPYWKYGASSKEVKWLIFQNFIGLGELVRLKAEIVMMPIIYQNRKVLSRRLVKLMERKHKKIWVWLHEGKQVVTIDSKNQFERIKKYNVDAFFTSSPEQLNKEMLTVT